MADGTIYIDTAIDENAIEKEMKDTERAIKRLNFICRKESFYVRYKNKG